MTINHKTILVPTNFSERSLHTLERSISIAECSNLDITLLHVYTKKHLKVEKNYEENCKKKLREIADKLSVKLNIKINILLEKSKEDKEYKVICEIANKMDAKFIVISTNDSPPKQERKFIGSTTQKVIKETKINLITMNVGRTRSKVYNIILPVDLTEESRQKVNHAIEIAKFYKSTIRVVSCLKTNDLDIISRQRLILLQVERFIRKNFVRCSTKLIELKEGDDENKCIINYAKEVLGDLLFVMIQQVKAKEQEALETIRDSDIPVMCIVSRNFSRAGAF